MSSFRWFRVTARGMLGLIQVAPIVALVLAVSFDRGPSGDAAALASPLSGRALDL